MQTLQPGWQRAFVALQVVLRKLICWYAQKFSATLHSIMTFWEIVKEHLREELALLKDVERYRSIVAVTRMKIPISILLFAATSVLGQNLQQATFYRLYGTNLYSFLPIASSPYRENYVVAGTVKRKDYGVAVIEKDLGSVFVFNADQDMLYAGPGELLKMLYVKERLEKTGEKISAGEWFSWDPLMRTYVTPTHKTQIYILNNCPDRVQVGEVQLIVSR